MDDNIIVPHKFDELSDAVVLTPETYGHIKQSMKDFLQEIADFLKERLITSKIPIETGNHYYDGYIKTVTKTDKGRVYYNLFRLEPENISPYRTGDSPIEDFDGHNAGRVSEETFIEVLRRRIMSRS